MAEKKLSRGGKRPGAGRPVNPDKPKGRFMFRCTDLEYEKIKSEADKMGMSINQYLVLRALDLAAK